MDKHELMQLFLEEALERSRELGNQLLLLEHNPYDKEIIQVIFRCAHTLKGNSTTFYNTILDIDPEEVTLPSINKIGTLTHSLENLIMEVRDNDLLLSAQRLDLLFEAEGIIETILEFIEAGEPESIDIAPLQNKLVATLSNDTNNIEENIETDSKHLEDFKEFKLSLNYDESFKHAYLSLVYRDIEDKYPNSSFEPTFDDLMKGIDFDEVVIKVQTSDKINTISSFLESIENVEKAFTCTDEIHPLEEDLSDKTKETLTSNTELDANTSLAHKQAADHNKDKSFVMNSTIKVAVNRIDEVLKHVSNLVILKNKLLNSAMEMNGDDLKEAKETAEEISQTVEFLQESVMNIRMTPLDHLFGRFPKDVRNIAKEFDKKVNFFHTGGDTEIDKSLLDELGDPLMHLIRNSVFHGIESEDERLNKGKEPIGNIYVSAKHEQGMVVISVEDDGHGIDLDKVVRKAVDKGIITEDKVRTATKNELANLIFHPGLSTAEKVTSVAGRGVGMDVVRSKIAEDMKGQIEIETELHKGTKIILRLPLTLAIINAMLTKINNDVYAFPSSQVESVEEISVNEIKRVANNEIYVLKERNLEVPIVRLNEFFNIETQLKSDKLRLIILKTGIHTIAVTVDEFIGHEDIVLKSLGQYLGNIQGIGGCNILGNGDIGLVVDVNSLLTQK